MARICAKLVTLRPRRCLDKPIQHLAPIIPTLFRPALCLSRACCVAAGQESGTDFLIQAYCSSTCHFKFEPLHSLSQECLCNLLLRRLKKVEDLPAMEEVIVFVEVVPDQLIYYKALIAGSICTLLKSKGAKNLPQMRNLPMEMRKFCCHPVSSVRQPPLITLHLCCVSEPSSGDCKRVQQ